MKKEHREERFAKCKNCNEDLLSPIEDESGFCNSCRFLIPENKTSLREEIIKKLEELKVTFPDWNNEDNRGREAMRLAWNEAIKEAIKIVEELKK